MRKIVQLSDLHFGRTDARVVTELGIIVNSLKPDVVVVSGDLTQRAKRGEFAAAYEFLQTLPQPQIIVPGNHDIALYNIWRRFTRPLQRFHEVLQIKDPPVYIDNEIAVLGLTSARSATLKGGRLNQKQIESIKNLAQPLAAEVVRIVVTHHPLTGLRRKGLLEQLMQIGVNVFLAGHLHKSDSGKIARRYEDQDHSALLVQAGTATSVRYRDESNSFNLITIEAGQVAVSCYLWQPERNKFALGTEKQFLVKLN